MKRQERASLQLRADILKALAHPSRLLMVEKLASGERCVQELQKEVGGDLSTVSKHLSVLKHAGIVESDKRGLQVYYRLKCACVVNFFQCIEDVIIERKTVA